MTDHHETNRFGVSPDSSLPLVAAVGMVAWLAFEFGLRRGLGPRIADALGSGLAAEGAIMVLAIPVVAGLVAWWGTRRGIDPADWEYDVTVRAVGTGLAGIAAYFAVYLALVIGYVTIVGTDQTAAMSSVGGLGAVPTWAIALYFVGNGVAVPIAEELAWRGVIQTALTEAYGTYVAVIVTALAFVGKHLVVDLAAPPLRVASLVVLAFLFCGLRARWGTASSTVAHVGINLIATASLLLAL